MKLRVGKNPRAVKRSSHQNSSTKKIIALGILIGAFFITVVALYLIGKNDSIAPDRNFIVTVDPVKKIVYGDTENSDESDSRLLYEVAGKVYEILSDGISSVASLANPSLKHVRIYSGMRKEEIADILAKKLDWDLSEEIKFMETRNELALADINSGEGYYFQGGYSFSTDATPAEVATTIITKFNEEVTNKFASSTKSVISLETALKIASIIERESNGKKDMRLISGIIWNRIFSGMSLDMDATLQYAKGTEKIGWWPKVVPNDKYIDSPYNTYQNIGLPPSPISSPSIAAIQAALNPKKTECLFYVHDKRRNIHCSVTYQQHVANIRRYY
jgi:UPF0755 protein